MGRARETLSQADSVLAGVFAAGRLGAEEHTRLVQIIGTARFLYEDGTADLPESDRVAYERLTRPGSAYVALDRLLTTLTAAPAPGPAPFAPQVWNPAYGTYVQQVRDFELAATGALSARAEPVATRILARLAAAALLGLAAVLICAWFSVRVGRSLIGRLTGLRAAALDLAEHRLPDVVGRLRRGEAVDVAAEAPPLRYGTDEIGQVGKALTEVQRTAVQSAVDEAALRRGLNEVFLNIARRSQALLHRQLAVLDTMERRTTDPAELEDLFRVDHLATRMRRHAEDLVILAGAKPGRGWRNPVPIVDVIRGAISEVEDYRRIDMTAVQEAHVAGRAVGDVIHLLAELLENAASFSPPHTRVHVAGQSVPHGYAVEIEDRGLGMSPEALDEANRALLEPPAFDPSDSARLGLFVVAQLGARHGVRVQLRPSPYGGVTAVALLPVALMTTGPGQAALPAAPTSPAVPGTPIAAAPQSPAAAPSSPAAARPPAVPRQRPPSQPDPARAPTPAAGPVVLNADGLAQRRRVTPAADPSPPTRSKAGLSQQDALPPVGGDGLPRRVRHGVVDAAPGTALWPAEPGPPGSAAAWPPIPPPRSPDDVRALMSGLQDGTRRGRRDATGAAPDATAVPAADPAPADRGQAAPAAGPPAELAPAAIPADGAGGPDPASGGDAAGQPGGETPAADRDADWSDGAPPGRLDPGWADAVTAPYPVADGAERPFVHVGEVLAPDKPPTASPIASPTVRPGSPRDAAEGEDG
jgi:signal transduction histidine kinase